MLKVYKSPYDYGGQEPVVIDNTVYIPQENDDDNNFVSEEELRKKHLEEKAAEEKRFNDAVNAEVRRIIEMRSAELEQQRINILDAANKAAKATAEDTKKTTAAVLERASKECAILKEKAKAEGFKEGFDEGKKQSMEKCSKYIDASAQLLSDINAHKDAYYISNEKELRETLFLMVQKITKAELKTDPAVIERIIADAAKGFRNSDYIKISLADGEVSREIKTDEKLIKKLIPFIPDIDVEILPDAEEGTVILDNNEEIVDASVPTQLDFLKEILKNTREKTTTEGTNNK